MGERGAERDRKNEQSLRNTHEEADQIQRPQRFQRNIVC